MKTVYQLTESGFFGGMTQAIESPREPGVYLLPAGSIEVAPPPETPAEGFAWFWTGEAWEQRELPKSPAELAKLNEPIPQLRPIQQVREEAIARMNESAAHRRQQGFISHALGENHYYLAAPADFDVLMMAAAASSFAPEGWIATLRVVDDDGKPLFMPHTAAQVQTAFLAFQGNLERIAVAYSLALDAIAAAQTMEELDAMIGLPSPPITTPGQADTPPASDPPVDQSPEA
ncbi:hypothetical protein [Cupriavidus sp. AcVe19-6a]|uniref:hypothetical protein n=1 Tax=Cupriavidus sp. AcVe19-6a TaxID=2821358 RepID=UPI001AE8785C|nr:hypothetical protein [Cupriavidus sp. AcVe19-6a]MBP0634919.1 hypothetical protein [Cupriavidus sp. AcVe19-6a]